MTRTAFPSPANIRRQTPDELFSRDAGYLFNNLTKEFEKNARVGSTKQNILIRRRGSYAGNTKAAAWIEWHQRSQDQRQYSIDYCNQKLSTTGWRVNGFTFRKVPQYVDSWYRNNRGSDMWAIIVEMEYACDDACAAK